MTRRSRFFSGIAFTVVLAACGSAADPLGPGDAGPSLNGGLVTGSNRTDTTSTGTTSTETPPPPPSDTTSRGGGLVTGSN